MPDLPDYSDEELVEIFARICADHQYEVSANVRRAAEQFFAVEDGGELPADIVEQGKCFGLFGIRREQAFGDGFGVAEKEATEFGEIIHSAGAAR